MNIKNGHLVLIILLTLFTGCAKFEPATCTLTANFNNTDATIICDALITNDGGCSSFTEQGYCVSFYDSPSLIDKYSEKVVLNIQTDSLAFSWKHIANIPDTTYYLVAYVKTNAGIGYSNILAVKTPADE